MNPRMGRTSGIYEYCSLGKCGKEIIATCKLV
jgi:hypothetical protein